MKDSNIHPSFRLNGISFTPADLQEQAYSFIKEGLAYEVAIGEFLLDWLAPAVTVVVQTSGSTGKPKQLVLKKEHMVNSALATGLFFRLEPENTALHCLPMEFIAGKMMLVRAMVLGLHISCIAPGSAPLNTISKHFDFAAMVPLQLRNSINKINLVKTLIVGGAPLSNDLKELVQDKLANIYETYGMTETITHIALKQVNHLVDKEIEQKVIGFETLTNVIVTLDERDCLVISAPDISDSEVVTNDVARLISDKEFEWLGRYDNIINSGGVKLIPEQIEAKLSKIIVQRYFVAGLLDKKLGQKLVLFIEGMVAKDALFEKLRSIEVLDKFEIPKDIIPVPSFTETKNGKINRIATIQSNS